MRKPCISIANSRLVRGLLAMVALLTVSFSGRAQSDDIVDIAAGNPDFSTLVEAVTKAELVEALQATGPFTVFAPTNEAFEKLFDQLGVSGVADLTKEQLTPILLYHVLGAKVLSTDLKAGQTVETLQSGLVTVLKQNGNVTVNGIHVILPDIEAANGVIHVIDRVLLPNDIVAVASANPDFSILVEAVAKAELVDALRAKGPFTVFAPTNDAFKKLFTALGVGGVGDLTKEQLTPILLYHVLSGAVLSTDLSNGLKAETLLEGNSVTVSIRGAAVRINQSNVILTNVAATNGVIHVLDNVLLPPGRVTSFTLVNAQTGEDIQMIEDSAVIDLADVDADQISVRVNVFPETVGSVVIALNDSVRKENFLPYALLGDSYQKIPVTYTPWMPESGEYTITATPYAVSYGRGAKGTPLSVTFTIEKPNTIVDVAVGNPDFSTLVAALAKAELVDALRADGPFTVFAPTNDAFKKLFDQLGVSGVDALTKEQLTPILLYHVLGAKVLSTDLKAGQTVETLQSGLVTVLKQDSNITVNGISVVLPDVEASNGVIHVIDRVLLPNDIVAVASANPDFSILVEAVAKAELVDALRAKGPFTVFAPTNTAFTNLFHQLGVSGVADLTKEQLTPILLYHVLSGAVLSTDLSDGLQAETLLEGNRITVSIAGTSVKVDESNVVLTNVAATNGVIHVLDAVLLPSGRVTALTLVNAETGEDIQTIEDGAVIDLAGLSAEKISVRADVFPEVVGSLRIALNDQVRTENFLPYSLLGDSYLKTPVTYNAWSPKSGEYTIAATPYTRSAGRGAKGTALSVTFTIEGMDAENVRLSVYPNPSPDRVYVNFADNATQEVTIRLYDNYGNLRLEEKKRVVAGQAEINLANVPTGVYLMKAVAGNRQETIRISKQ